MDMTLPKDEGTGASPDPDRYAVPVGFWDPDRAVGTGFLGRRDGCVSFYTAAHVLSHKPFWEPIWPIDGWKWLNPTLPVYIAPRPSSPFIRVSTKSTTGPQNEPNFTWLGPGDNYIRDAVKFNLSSLAGSQDQILANFAAIDLDSAVHQLDEGDELTCVGFPPRGGETGEWPYFPPSRTSGKYLGILGHGSFLANFEAAGGYSGGPVFTKDGRFAGMLTGMSSTFIPHRTRSARIVHPNHILDL